MMRLACQLAKTGNWAQKIVGLRSGLPGMVYSHCELYWERTGEAFAVLASGIGWKKRDYGGSEDAEHRQWDLYPLPLDEEEQEYARSLCNEFLKKNPKYDWPGILKIGTLHLLGREIPQWWFCSEQCAWVFRRLGYTELFCLSPDSYPPSLVAYTVRQWWLLPQNVREGLRSMAKARRGTR